MSKKTLGNKNVYGEEAIFKGTMRINFPELKKSNISQLNSDWKGRINENKSKPNHIEVKLRA